MVKSVVYALVVAAGVAAVLYNQLINNKAYLPDDLPKTMKALRIYGPRVGNKGLGDLRVETIPMPEVPKGHLLIKVMSAPVNPSDVYFMQGTYSQPASYPSGVGFEGSGVVIGHGGGLVQLLLRQRVSFFTSGASYAEYVVVPFENVVVLSSHVSYDQGASGVVNPMTVVGMVSTARWAGHKAAVSTAAASSLGKMLMKYGKMEGFPIINVVRREEQRELLVSLGAIREDVILSTDKNYIEQLSEACLRVGATVALDAISGQSSVDVLQALPPKSEIYVYGALSNEPVAPISPFLLMMEEKTVKGWHLKKYFDRISFISKFMMAMKVKELLGKELSTEYNMEASIDDIMTVVPKYMENATNNKIVVHMHATQNE
eukprot:m.4543 g.4543  ORF g.4543 m.4543 type:complete len:374 (+) comp2249_c0_seq1:19-1140(+)